MAFAHRNFQHGKKDPSATEIAQVLGVTRQNVRKMLEPLCAKGYVTLTVNAQDKRNLSVALTEKTMLFFERFEPRGTAFLQALFNGIPKESQEITRKTVGALLGNIEGMKRQYGKGD